MPGLRRRGPDDQALPAAGARPRHPDQQAHEPHDHRTDHRPGTGVADGPEGSSGVFAGRLHPRLEVDLVQREGVLRLPAGGHPASGEHIENKLAHAGLSTITIKKNKNEVEVNIHTARPGIVIGKSGSEVDALRKELHKHDRQGRQGQHPRDQAPGARREARRPVDRRAAAEPRRLPARDEARAHQRHALRRQGREDPGLRPPRRGRDGAHRGLLRRPRAAAHAPRRHRLRLLRGPHHLRPHRREGLDQQGRDHAQGLRPGPDRARGARRPSGPVAAGAARVAAAAVRAAAVRGPGGGGVAVAAVAAAVAAAPGGPPQGGRL